LEDLIDKLSILFTEPGGVRIEDVQGVNDSQSTFEFLNKLKDYKNDEARNETLFQLGKVSMKLWESLFDSADATLKQIFIDSNFQPCHEFAGGNKKLHTGYRIDLIHDTEDANAIAHEIISRYNAAGYKHCCVLTPQETQRIDPFLKDFCEANAVNKDEWNKTSCAIFRPGGCIDTNVFLPKFYAYLADLMGEYRNPDGTSTPAFQLHVDTQVTGIVYREDTNSEMMIERLQLSKTENETLHSDLANYVFCPGESIGTLHKLGFQEPASVGFAGASLKLIITLPENLSAKYRALNHCMSIVNETIHLAWQARFVADKVLIGIAGTRAFYSDVVPQNNDSFAHAEHLLQLNIINDVFPELIALALGKSSKELVQEDLLLLQNKNIAIRWVGNRSFAYDGFPTLGQIYHASGRNIANARCTTHLGSGGVSFSPAAVLVSRSQILPPDPDFKKLCNDVLNYSSADR
jgi:hypothetical protein